MEMVLLAMMFKAGTTIKIALFEKTPATFTILGIGNYSFIKKFIAFIKYYLCVDLKLSAVDKELLKILLVPDGKRPSASLSKKLGIPLTTIQRRRKRLEKEFLQSSYSLNLDKFGWRRIDFLISTRNGKTDEVANKLIELDQVTYVGKSIGEHTIDLRAETIVKDNGQLLDLLEKIKAMEGVNDAIWSEIVKVVGRKRSIPSNIIDQLGI
jgi:DNA-binding Lrp family transcriptional regulator